MIARESERWMDLPGYEDLYQVSTQGRVRRLARVDELGHRWPATLRRIAIRPNGRRYVNLCKKGAVETASVSVLAARVYRIPNPRNRAFVIHRNSDNADFRRENLRWVTLPELRMHDGRKVCPYYGVSRLARKPGSKGVLRWVAAIRIDRRRRNLGYFANPEEAAYAYDREVRRLRLRRPLNNLRKPKPYTATIEALPGEVWRPFPKQEVTHMISNKGRVRTLAYRTARGNRVLPRLRKITVDRNGCRTIVIEGRRYGLTTILTQVFPASRQRIPTQRPRQHVRRRK